MNYHTVFDIFERAANLKLSSAANYGALWAKETKSATMNIFQKKNFRFRSFVKQN